jgi:hypothetical protein
MESSLHSDDGPQFIFVCHVRHTVYCTRYDIHVPRMQDRVQGHDVMGFY